MVHSASQIQAWSYFAFDSAFWKDLHYDSLLSSSYDKMERSLLVPREVLTGFFLLITALVVALLGDEAGGEETVFVLAPMYPIYATIRCYTAR